MSSFNFPYVPKEKLLSPDRENTFELLPDGIYDYEIKDCVVQKTEKLPPTDYLDLTFTILGPSYAKRLMWDKVYSTQASIWRLYKFLDSCGSPSLYSESGSFQGHLVIGKRGSFEIGRESKPGYKEKNIVKAYLPKKDGGESSYSHSPSTTTKQDDDDDIPF